ncbi:MAG TPA: glycosyltransferase [Candidatus Paceibacterota bacterium]|nr:glycosyltransferase [Candidatus Paceibacterota bacterium]
MPIFLDTSKRRKLFIRVFAVTFASITFLGLVFLAVSVFFESPQRPALTYAEAADSYHYYYSSANDHKIAITFNDGPQPGISQSLMATLEKDNAPATFFYIGENVFMHPNIVHEAATEGFTIGNQSFTGSDNVESSATRLSLELHATEFLISRITGASSFFYRPPYLLGVGTDPTMNPYLPPSQDILWAMENGYNPVGADIDPNDWKADTKEDVESGVIAALKSSPNGHILLLHERPQTAEAMDAIVQTIRKSGYTIVPLSELLTPPAQLALTQPLQQGDTDATTEGQVSQLQWFLYKDGDLDPYLITGTFGSLTRTALIRFQLKSNILNGGSASAGAGIADAATRKAIESRSVAVLQHNALFNAPVLHPFAFTWIGQLFAFAYINLFPALHDGLSAIMWLALFIVLIRCAALLGLLAWAKRQERLAKIGDPEDMGEGISVLIPAYNEEENIRATIESVLHSNYQPKEVIVIDDGSTDGTGGVVREAMAAHPDEPIRLLQVENGGKASALNHGLEAAQFNICAVLDADAVIEEGTLSYFARHFKDAEVGAVAGKVCTTASARVLDMLQTLEYAIGQNINKRALSTIGAIGVVPGPSGAWNKRFVLEAGGFSTDTLVEDQDMTLTLLRAGRKVVYEEKAVAYTETPHTVKNFLKQRFRWVYGTLQCFWKHKRVVIEHPLSSMSLIVLPNIIVFNTLLPLTYPFSDLSLVIGLLVSDWHGLVLPFLLFTAFDVSYAAVGVWREKDRVRMLAYVPLQRFVYRQLLYYTVMRGLIRALEGTGSGWNKFSKIGETQRFYFSALGESPEPVLDFLPSFSPLPDLSTSSSPSTSGMLSLSESSDLQT